MMSGEKRVNQESNREGKEGQRDRQIDKDRCLTVSDAPITSVTSVSSKSSLISSISITISYVTPAVQLVRSSK